MPGRFLTHAERERLTRFPVEIPPEDLVSAFTLSPTDITRVLLHRGQPNYLGFALQICALRYVGFAPDDLLAAPSSVVKYVARQLGVSPEALKQYGTRPQTRTDHLQEILSYLEFREASATDLQALASFVLERALEHDKPIVLFQMACEHLKSKRIVRAFRDDSGTHGDHRTGTSRTRNVPSSATVAHRRTSCQARSGPGS